MKKKSATILAAILALTTISPMLSCGSKVSNAENVIEYQLKEGGYGLKWFEEATKKFKELHPDVKFVKTKKASKYGEAKTMLAAGPKVTTCDLFMGSEPVMEYALYGDSLLSGCDCVLEDLSDVYNATVEGVQVKDKLIKGYVDAYSLEVDGETKYYAFPWVSGVLGIVYNATKFEEFGLRVPRTTDELFDDTCRVIKENDKIPFVDTKTNSYLDYLGRVWQNQYHGAEELELQLQGKVYNADSGRYEYSVDAFKSKSVLYLADAKEKMIGVRYGNMHENVNTMTFTQAQAQLLLGRGLMYICGDWLENEMKTHKGNGDTLKYMKTPILSGIIDKTPTIPDDATLREVVSYVDGEIDEAPVGVSEADISYIRSARKIECLTTFQSAYIPSYSTSKYWAKEFLKFLVTEDMVKMCLDETGGSSVPTHYDIRSDVERWGKLSPFMQSKYDLLEEAQTTVDPRKFRLQVFGGLKVHSSKYTSGAFTLYASKNAKDRVTAEQYYQDRLNYLKRSMLDEALQRAGLI